MNFSGRVRGPDGSGEGEPRRKKTRYIWQFNDPTTSDVLVEVQVQNQLNQFAVLRAPLPQTGSDAQRAYRRPDQFHTLGSASTEHVKAQHTAAGLQTQTPETILQQQIKVEGNRTDFPARGHHGLPGEIACEGSLPNTNLPKRLYCHAITLASASPYLRSLLEGGCPGNTVSIAVLPEEISAAEAMLQFCYTDHLHLTDDQEVLRCLVLANRHQMHDCVEACCTQLLPQLSSAVVPWHIVLAVLQLPIGATAGAAVNELVGECHAAVYKVFGRLEDAWQSGKMHHQFLALPYSALKELLTRDDLVVVSENTVVVAASCWMAMHAAECTAQERAQLMALLRVPHLTASFLSGLLDEFQWLRESDSPMPSIPGITALSLQEQASGIQALPTGSPSSSTLDFSLPTRSRPYPLQLPAEPLPPSLPCLSNELRSPGLHSSASSGELNFDLFSSSLSSGWRTAAASSRPRASEARSLHLRIPCVLDLAHLRQCFAMRWGQEYCGVLSKDTWFNGFCWRLVLKGSGNLDHRNRSLSVGLECSLKVGSEKLAVVQAVDVQVCFEVWVKVAGAPGYRRRQHTGTLRMGGGMQSGIHWFEDFFGFDVLEDVDDEICRSWDGYVQNGKLMMGCIIHSCS